MKRQISHLITGAELAIANGLPVCMNVASNNEVKLQQEEFTVKMYQVLKHYQDGGSIFTRP